MKINIEFNEGFIYVNNIKHILFPSLSLILILEKLNQNNKINNIENIFDIDLISFFNNYKKRDKDKHFLNYLSQIGIGELIIIKNSSTKKIIKLENNISKIIYKNTNLKDILSLFIGKIIKRYYEIKTQKIHKLEIKKNNNTYFILTPTNKKLTKINIKLETSYIKENIYTKKRKKSINNLVKKLIISKHISNKYGHFKIWNSYGILIPYITTMCLLSKFRTKEEENFLKELAIKQAIVALEYQKKYFKIKINKITKLLEQTELIGIGKLNQYNNCFKKINEFFTKNKIDCNSKNAKIYTETVIKIIKIKKDNEIKEIENKYMKDNLIKKNYNLKNLIYKF
jgi:hypothetical protein